MNVTTLTDWVKSDLLETINPPATPRAARAALPIGLNRTYWKHELLLSDVYWFFATLPIGLNRTYWKQSLFVDETFFPLDTLPIGLNRTYWKRHVNADGEGLIRIALPIGLNRTYWKRLMDIELLSPFLVPYRLG